MIRISSRLVNTNTGVKMIKSKKMVTIAALCAFTAAFSFAQEVSFENKLSSEIVNINITEDDTESTFAGFFIKNSILHNLLQSAI